MKKSLLLAVALVAFAASPSFAATKTYQVTGPVTAMSDDTITVQKGSEKWEIARGTAGVPADVKVGSKVTVQYSMTADSVVSKPLSKSADAAASKLLKAPGSAASSASTAVSSAAATTTTTVTTTTAAVPSPTLPTASIPTPSLPTSSLMQPAMATGAPTTPSATK